MNPGSGKVHRDCAARCISGGIPPALLVRDAQGRGNTILLTNADGGAPHRDILNFVAEPVTVAGELVRHGAVLVLKMDSAGFQRE